MAVYPTGPVETVLLHPVFKVPFVCGEHDFGEETIAGDALGTDCQVSGGVLDKNRSFARLYRTDGAKNEDWYSWGADVLAPTAGVVTGLLPNPRVNAPGTKGRPPAGMMQITRADGIVVTFAHITDFAVALGDKVQGRPAGRQGRQQRPVLRAPRAHRRIERRRRCRSGGTKRRWRSCGGGKGDEPAPPGSRGTV